MYIILKYIMVRDRHYELSQFIEDNKDLDVQGSKGWHEKRTTAFGGSELKIVISGKTDNLIKEKAGVIPRQFNGNIYTDAGTLFEDLSRLYAQILFNISIYEFGSCSTIIDGLNISPDGIGCVRHKKVLRKSVILPQYEEFFKTYSDKYANILIEIKSPYTRIPKQNGYKLYSHQIQGGIHGLPLIDYAIFIDSSIRRCKLTDLTTDIFVPNTQSDIETYTDTPTAWGIMAIYDKFNTFTDLSVAYIYDDVKYVIDKPIDAGKLNDKDIRKFYRIINKMTFKDYMFNVFTPPSTLSPMTDAEIEQTITSIRRTSCHPFSEEQLFEIDRESSLYLTQPTEEQIQEAISKFKTYASTHNKKFIGVIPWKLLRCEIIPIPPDEKFATIAIPIIKEHTNKLRQFVKNEAQSILESIDEDSESEDEDIYI